ncbi:50S ribosomal protein L3 N(5)-glutamine methyltransferase [Candidatus Rickettsiella isopodorum]|uniref:50S ribosomal protein L3 N(5)-glutamine methyltransferase n=1 Tax=Candidatus Rickettsiella isopodorum TaxID=1225476 RepID=UPI000A02C5DA|nr:50S ribosomal protein L3 N(5)-glutamine methyltransferase [Candidatus Rickettsiella isopodorum]
MAKLSYCISDEELKAALLEFRHLQDILRWGYTQFNKANLYYGHGTDNVWDEIVYLVLSTLKLGPHLNPCFLGASLSLAERRLLIENIRQRVEERIPTAYLVNEARFAGLTFYVDARVLIPRSPIAELIQHAFTPWVEDTKRINTLLDIGTGSGCIAIACAYAFPEARVDAIDNSKDALTVAAVNVAAHKLQGQINLIHSDLFENLDSRLYDIIISNPPYVDAEDFASLPIEYQHEPAMALAAGKEGLDFVIQILRHANKYLKKKGILIVEVGNSKSALVKRYPQIPFLWLEFEQGEAEIFLLTQEQLTRYEQEI